ncbi:MAG: hypothetical protein OXC19_11895, partial [Bryobacterales bacterium]|nr:hypothetical protein [Bryobacterales bacterium]
GLAAADRNKLWGPAHEDPQEAVDAMIGRLDSSARVVVIPEGPYVFSQVGQGTDRDADSGRSTLRPPL